MPPIRILTQFFTLVADVLLDGDVHLGGAEEKQKDIGQAGESIAKSEQPTNWLSWRCSPRAHIGCVEWSVIKECDSK